MKEEGSSENEDEASVKRRRLTTSGPTQQLDQPARGYIYIPDYEPTRSDWGNNSTVSYTHPRAHEPHEQLVLRHHL